MKSKLAILFSLALIGASAAHAVHYNFDITFDGTDASVDGSSDPIDGTTLEVGDTFSLDVHAAGSAYWLVNTSFFSFFDLTFTLSEDASRVVSATTTLLLDGLLVAQDIENSIDQEFIHIGNQNFNWVAGTQFDQIIVDVTFESIDDLSAETTIVSQPDILGSYSDPERPFFRRSQIDYVAAASVPDTGSTIALMLIALSAFVGIRRRRS